MTESGYGNGGGSTRRNRLKTWLPRKYSPTTDINQNLTLLRNRSADLAINTALGSAVINTLSLYVVGDGLRLSPKINAKALGMSREEAKEWENRVKLEWELFSSNIDLDYYRRNNFNDLQQIAYQSSLIDGDAFVLFRRVAPESISQPYTLRLQIVEGNRITNPNSAGDQTGYIVRNPENGNRIIDGVEVDERGILEAYWIASSVPNDPIDNQYKKVKWDRVRAYGELTGYRNILQITRDERSGMTRGVPILAPVIETLRQISLYVNAELDSAITRAFYSLFFTQFTQPNSFNLNELKEEDREPIDTTGFNLGPGTIASLPMGIDVKSIESSKQSAFPAFVVELVKQVGASIGIPYEVLMRSFTSSYSASRASLLQAWSNFRRQRACFIRDFCKPIYEVFLIEGIVNGRIEAPGFFEDPIRRLAWSNANFYGNSMEILDPLKEVNASRLRMELGLSTLEKESSEITSTNYEENLEQLDYENALKGLKKE